MKIKHIFLPLMIGCLLGVSSVCSAEELPISGTLYPNLITKISTQITGRVQEVFVGTGALVEKGQVLAKLDPLNFEIDVKKCRCAVELAKLAYEDAKTHYVRMKKLWDKDDKESAAIPKTQYDGARSQLMQTKLLLDQAELNLEQVEHRLDETEIKAPYKGVITGRFVDPGESVLSMGGGPLFEIMDTSKLVFEFTLPQNMLGKIKQGQRVTSELCKGGGTIFSILPQVDAMSRSLKCRVLIPNDTLYLKPGLFVTAKMQIEEGD